MTARLPGAFFVAAVALLCVPPSTVAAPCSGVSVGPATTVVSDATRDALGLNGWPDTAFGVLRESDGRFRFLGTEWVAGAPEPAERVVATRGTLANPVAGGVLSRTWIAGAPPGYAYVGGGPVYRDPATGIILQVLHHEQRLPGGGFYATLHLGRFDPDTGGTRYLGPIVSPDVDFASAKALDWTVDVGTSSLTVVDGYLRVYFADYRLNERGTGLVATGLSTARARVSDVVAAAASGNVVPWAKYHNGGWSSPALGGPSTNIRPGHAPWGPNVARHGDGATTMVAGISPREMVLSSSPNGTTGWSDEVPLFREPQRFVMYPTVVGLGDKPSVLGERFYLYYTQFEGPSVPPDWRNVTVRRRLIRCTAGMPPAQVPFVRYAGGGRHRATTLNVTDPGMAPERGGVWYLLDAKAPGTRPLYGCRSAAGGYFASIDPRCEGGDNALSHSEGWIYADPPAAPWRALYSCYFPRTDDYLVSIHATCESPNAVRKGLLGYALTTSKVAFSRFFDGSEHWETTGPVSDRYSLQRRWFLEGAPKPGTVALYGCHYSIPGGVNHFISIHPDCEGVNRLRTEGWIHTSPPEGKPSTPLYRCYRPAAYDHFLATGRDCEGVPGAVEAGLMGYAETN